MLLLHIYIFGVILLHNLWILLFKFEGMKKYRGILELTLIEIEKNDMSTKMTFFFFEWSCKCY